MQHLYTCVFCCLFLFSIPLSAQRVVTSPGTFSDLTYVPARDRLYAVTPESGNPANSLCLIDQATGEILESYSVGLNPSKVVATTSGDYLYIAFRGENRVRRFSLATNAVDLDFSIGGDEDFDGPYYAEDILPIRSSDELLAVARSSAYAYPRAKGVVLFENGVQRPYAAGEFPPSTSLVYTDQDELILGYDNDYYYQFQGFAVADFSLSPTSTYGGFYVPSGRMEYTEGTIYAANGQIATVNEGVPVLANGLGLEYLYPYAETAVEAVPEANRLYYLGTGWGSGRLSVSVYELSSLNYLGTLEIAPLAEGLAWEGGKELTRLAAPESMAFLSNDNGLGIITLCNSGFPEPPPSYTGNVYYCPGDSLLLSVPNDILGDGETIVWSTGQTGNGVYVKEEGAYAYRIVDAGGCPGPFSDYFYVSQIYYGLDAPYLDEPVTEVLCTGSSVELRANYYYGPTVIWNTGDTTPILTVTEPGTYVAYGINPEYGCRSYSSDPIVITALDAPAPAAPVVDQGLFIDTCTTDLISLSVDRADLFYYWTTDYAGYYYEGEETNVISVYPYYDRVTNFTVQSLDDNGCVSPVTTGQIKFRLPPDVPTIQYNEATTTLASNLSGPLYWYREDVFEGESLGRYYRPRRNGFYSARKKGPFCLSEPSNLVSVGGVTTSIYDEALSEQVLVFPVPARETVNVSVGSGLVWNLAPGMLEYRLFNTAGALITTGMLDPQVPSTPISVAGLPSGMYTLTLATQDGKMLRKRITVM